MPLARLLAEMSASLAFLWLIFATAAGDPS